MGLVKKRGYYYWVKRVPKRYLGVVVGSDGKPVQQVRQALHTDSKVLALSKAAQVEAARIAEWESALKGRPKDARMHYLAAKELAESQGFEYRQLHDILTDDLAQLVPRVEAAMGPRDAMASNVVTEAILGAVPPVLPTLPVVLDEFIALTKTKHLKKSESQKHRWKLPRTRAVGNFVQVCETAGRGGLRVDQISRADTLRFRDWWAERIQQGYSANSANKEIGALSGIFSTWAELNGLDLPNPFAKLFLEGGDNTRTPSFSREWVKTALLKPGAFDGLNDEARDIFFVTINTGLRPSEVSDAPVEDFRVFDNIPHIIVAPNGRELKVKHTSREIPLTGVSLEAARRIVARGGVQRYKNKANGWSAIVNKYMVNNGLKESPKHTAYSVRHYVEDALLAAHVDDRIRADILGHKYNRPNYGDGGGLAGRLAALEKIAL